MRRMRSTRPRRPPVPGRDASGVARRRFPARPAPLAWGPDDLSSRTGNLLAMHQGQQEPRPRVADKANAERSDDMPYLRLEPTLDGLRSDDRFVALVGRVGLPGR